MPAKSNDTILQKKLKKNIFGSFLTTIKFPKKLSCLKNSKWAPNTMPSFSINNGPIPRKLPNKQKFGQKNGETKGQTDPNS